MNDLDHFSLPKKWRTPRPMFVVSLVAILIIVGVATGYLEITQSRKEIMGLLQKEASSLIEALSLSGENAARAYGELEGIVDRSLLNTAEILNSEEAAGTLTARHFKEILTGGDVVIALAADSRGESSGPEFPAGIHASLQPSQIAGLVAPLFQRDSDSVSGLLDDASGQTYYAVAIMRPRASTAQNGGSAWVLCTDPQPLFEFRRRVGIGRLIQDIGENSEIAYIALQDTLGIISATKNVSSMSSLSADPFLAGALLANEPESRLFRFEGNQVFEVVRPFIVDGTTFGLFRIGLEMDAVERAVSRTRQRAILVGVGFLVVGVVLFNFLVTHQNYRLLTDAYAQIKTYTGNILENMADAVVAVDRDAHITVFNRAAERLFKRSSREAIGKRCGDIIGKQHSLLEQALEKGQGVRDTEMSYRLDGERSTLSVTTTLLRNEDGSVHSAVAVLKDLTEKKSLEENLRQRERLSAMGELAAGVAHEIRNPLNAIAMIAQRFEKEFTPTADDQEYRQLARSVVSESRRVSDIIQRFLEFAKPPDLHLEASDLSELAAKAASLVASQAREKAVSLKTNLEDGLVLSLDRNQMGQVFLNLLQNSLHATSYGGEIVVSTLHRDDGAAVAEIADTGIGIPGEHLNKIFDLYFTTKEDGTGMGLSLSHRIVSQHGGRIEVESEVGKGTTIRLIFPAPAGRDPSAGSEIRP